MVLSNHININVLVYAFVGFNSVGKIQTTYFVFVCLFVFSQGFDNADFSH